ncbi:MAG: hypothetical protein BYD32DRAFT_138300 [Podila humilis]|nr:MAG: hypothetical protein BYD32DRAFT_138300 [Podila humilis]
MTDPSDLNDNSRVLAISNNPGAAGSLGTVVNRIATLKTHPAMISDPTKTANHVPSVSQASVHSALLQQQQQQHLANLHELELSNFVNQQQLAPGLGQNMSGSSARGTMGVSGADGQISEGLSVDLSSQALQQQAQQQVQQQAQQHTQLMMLQQQQAQQAQAQMAQQQIQQQVQQQVQQQLQSVQSSPQLPPPLTQAPDQSNGEGSSTQPQLQQPIGTTNDESEVLVAPNKDLEFPSLDLAQEYALRYAKSVGCAAIVKRTTKDKLGAVVQILLVSGRAFTAADQKSQAKGTLKQNAVDVLG